MAPNSFAGAGEFRPDISEGTSLYVPPLAFVTKGAEPGPGPETVDPTGSKVND